MDKILKFVVGSFGLDSILLTEGSALEPSFQILKYEGPYYPVAGNPLDYYLCHCPGDIM
jgi:hypothetical protein